LRKELNGLEKQAKKTLRQNKSAASEAGKIYLQKLSVESFPNLLYNIGLCYKAIGNYTKAQQYLAKSGKASKDNISTIINERKTLEKYGIEIVERDF
jgi:tetratricopeptide (TPR) repeat protein